MWLFVVDEREICGQRWTIKQSFCDERLGLIMSREKMETSKRNQGVFERKSIGCS
jgi:hypothetical protein